MPREHVFEPGDYDYVCKHCGADAYDVTLMEGTGMDIQCLNWTDIPKVKKRPRRKTLWEEIKEIFS